MIGAYRKNKGYEIVLKNFQRLKKIIPNLKIETFGYDNPQELSQFIENRKINDFKINKFEKNIVKKIINFNVLLHPSYREGLSVSIMQSLQYGIPVIARNIAGNKDLIKNNYNGYLFNHDTEMIMYLKKIYKSPNLRNKLSRNASKTLTNKFLKNSINEKVKKFINRF